MTTKGRPRESLVVLVDEKITSAIIGAFYKVYNTLGYGLSERIYALAMRKELTARGHAVAMEVKVPVRYLGELLQYQRLDLLVDDRVIVEVKATPVLAHGAHKQLHNYLRLTPHNIGLLLHFGPDPSFARLIHTRKQA